MVHAQTIENEIFFVPEDGLDDDEFAKYQEDIGLLKRCDHHVSSVHEDGFDDFELAKYLEDCGMLRRSHSLPVALTKCVSSTVEKVQSMCSFVQSTMTPSSDVFNENSDEDYMETAYSIVHRVSSDYDEIRNIVTGGAVDGWYTISSPGRSAAPFLGTAPSSPQKISLGNLITNTTPSCQMRVHSLGFNATNVLASSTVTTTRRSETPDAGDRPIVQIFERTRLHTSATPSTASTEEPRNDTSEESTPKTTLMLCNLPKQYSRCMVMDVLRSEGFADHVELIYVPMNLRSFDNFGYAFVQFDSEKITLQCKETLQGFNAWSEASEKRMDIKWSDSAQGLAANLERYRNSPIMHESVQDEFKPALFKRGVRVAFPKPTKTIRAPKLGR